MHEPFWNSAVVEQDSTTAVCTSTKPAAQYGCEKCPVISTNQKKRKAPSCDGIKYITSSNTKNRNIKGCSCIKGCSYIIRLHFTLTKLHGGREIGMNFLMANIFR